MKKVIIVDVSKNSAPYSGVITHKVEELIGQLGNCALETFDTFPYGTYDALEFQSAGAYYDCPCAYYDCMIEIIRQYAYKDCGLVKFYIISNNMDDCSRLADEEIFEMFINHTKSHYGALYEYIAPAETKESGVPGYLSTYFTNLFIRIRNFGIRYDTDPSDDTDDNYDEYDDASNMNSHLAISCGGVRL